MSNHPNITLSPVTSSQIESIGHSGDTLAVKFKSGGLYHYHGVTSGQHADLIGAESIGKHLSQHIKSKHKFTKVS